MIELIGIIIVGLLVFFFVVVPVLVGCSFIVLGVIAVIAAVFRPPG